MSRPMLRVKTGRPYRILFPDWEQTTSPEQEDLSVERDLRVSCLYAHPSDLDAANSANLAGFAGSPVSPVSAGSVQFQWSDWIEAHVFDPVTEPAITQESQPDALFNPALTDIRGFEPEFFFDYPSELAFSPAPHGNFPSIVDSLFATASGEPPLEGLIGNPFIPMGSIFDEPYPVARPPVQPLLSHPRPRPIPREIHNLIDTKLPELNFSCEESDIADGPDFSIPLQRPDWPTVEDFALAFPDPISYTTKGPTGTPMSLQTPVPGKPKKLMPCQERWFKEGAARQQAKAGPTSQASQDRLARLREEHRVFRETKAEKAKEEMANRRSRRLQLAPLQPAPLYFPPHPPRGLPPPLPARRHPWQFGPLAPGHPPVVTGRFVPLEHAVLLAPQQNMPPPDRRLKRPAEDSKENLPKIILIDGVPYQKLSQVPASPRPPTGTQEPPKVPSENQSNPTTTGKAS